MAKPHIGSPHLCSVKIVGICGSLRTGSYNKTLLHHTLKKAEAKGAQTEILDLKANVLPFYDQDLEAAKGLNFDAVGKVRKQLEESNAVVIACPEYNASITAVLKNLIDWTSRSPNMWQGKHVGVVGGAGGIFGTVRAQIHLRTILSMLNANMLPSSVTVPSVYKVINDKGEILDKLTDDSIEKLADDLVNSVRNAKLVDVTKKKINVKGFEFLD